MANGRCHLCGGKSPGAPLKHGRRSKFLPVRLMERYEEVLAEGDVLSLEDDLAVAEALIRDNFSAITLDAAKSAELWQEARAKYHEVLKNGPAAKESFVELGRILDNGFGESSRIDRHWDFTERKRRIAETEGRRQAAAYLSISLKEMAALQAFILGILKEKIPDRRVLSDVHAALMAGISRRSSGGSG